MKSLHKCLTTMRETWPRIPGSKIKILTVKERSDLLQLSMSILSHFKPDRTYIQLDYPLQILIRFCLFLLSLVCRFLIGQVIAMSILVYWITKIISRLFSRSSTLLLWITKIDRRIWANEDFTTCSWSTLPGNCLYAVCKIGVWAVSAPEGQDLDALAHHVWWFGQCVLRSCWMIHCSETLRIYSYH